MHLLNYLHKSDPETEIGSVVRWKAPVALAGIQDCCRPLHDAAIGSGSMKQSHARSEVFTHL